MGRHMTDQRSEWLSRREAAALAGVHYNTVRGWERDGKLRTKTFPGPSGPEVHVAREDLDQLIAERPPREPRTSADEELARYREEVARLQGEIAVLRERIDFLIQDREVLLREVLEIARGGRARGGGTERRSP